jgi:hypothetical protein
MDGPFEHKPYLIVIANSMDVDRNIVRKISEEASTSSMDYSGINFSTSHRSCTHLQLTIYTQFTSMNPQNILTKE